MEIFFESSAYVCVSVEVCTVQIHCTSKHFVDVKQENSERSLLYIVFPKTMCVVSKGGTYKEGS